MSEPEGKGEWWLTHFISDPSAGDKLPLELTNASEHGSE